MPVLDDIYEAAEALTDARSHAEPRYEWDTNRHRKPIEPHRTTVPGLIQQLRDAAEPGVDGEQGGGGGRESCPVAIDAVSLLAAIAFGAAHRCQRHNITKRATPEDDIRALVGAAGRMDSDEQNLLRRELQSWRHQAEVITGWRQPARTLLAPCLVCGIRGTVLVAADASAAWCTNPDAGRQDGTVGRCEGRWDAQTIGVVAQHEQRYREQAKAAQREAWERAGAEQRRKDGRAA